MPPAEPRAVRARAWCRVDLAGGTFDIWPLGLLHRGARTVNLAIDLPVTVEIRRREAGYRVLQEERSIEAAAPADLVERPECALIGLIALELGLPPSDISIASGSPRGGGLGASSALSAALIAGAEALAGAEPSPPPRRAALVRDLEARLMGLPTGCQDQYAAMLGGLLEIRYAPGGERVRRLVEDPSELGDALVVAYTGSSHLSGARNWDVVRGRLDGRAELVDLFDGIAEAARYLGAAVEAGDLAEAGRRMTEEWSCRRRLAEGISTPAIERMLGAAAAAGAWGGKACGAGGGGSIAVLGPPRSRGAIVEALCAEGAEILPAGAASGPLEVTSLDG